jgi:drug/metabolite transporter (DMT)-like permease
MPWRKSIVQEINQITEQAQVQIGAILPRRSHLKYELVLVLMSMIWGATFLVTKGTLRLIGPFTYLGLCYTVATLTLVGIFHKRLMRLTRVELLSGCLIGVFLFAGYGFQTVGLQWTTVSKAGFLTGLYVPLVPLFALLFLRQRIPGVALLGVALSVIGLLLLSLSPQFNLVFGKGEVLLLCCAVAFALQVILVGKFAPDVDAINLAIVQLGLTAVLSFIAVPLAHEPIAPPPLIAWIPVLLLGLLDMAFTLTAMNWIQQYVSSTRATLIYSLEPMWAAFFGLLLAGDVLSLMAWLGCLSIFSGMVIGRLDGISLRRRKRALSVDTIIPLAEHDRSVFLPLEKERE